MADHQYVTMGAGTDLAAVLNQGAERRAEIDPVGPAGSHSHIFSFLLNVLALSLLVALCASKSKVPLAVAFGLSYLIYIVHVFGGGAYAYLSAMSSTGVISSVIDEIHREPGELFIKCECSHQTSSTSTDSDGNSSSSTSTKVTFRNRTRVPINTWTDVSDRLPDWAQAAPEICKVKSEAAYEFANEESARYVERLTALVYATHRNRDRDCEVACEYELRGLLPRMLLLPSQKRPPWWLSSFWFLSASFFLLSWPYRMLLEANSVRLRVCFRKLYTINANTPLVVNMENEDD